MIRPALSLMVLFSIPSNALPQGMTPPNGLAGPSPNDNGVPLLLRIPAAWIAKSVNRDFEHKAPVNQVILGTTSSGNTHCKGQVTCSVMDNPTGVSILCSIDGTVNSVTCGANGPAIISSKSVTLYHSTKTLTFDGKRFASNPASLSSCTQVTITGVGSSLPGFRGRLVTRIAANRAQESLPQVEAIVKTQTEAELCQSIDADFEARIADLNIQFTSKLSILKYMPVAQSRMHLCSGKDGVEIALGHSPRGSEEDKERRAAIGQTVEVWWRRNDNLIANRPMSALNFNKAPIWLSAYFAAAPIFLKTDERKLGIEAGDKWIVVKLHH